MSIKKLAGVLFLMLTLSTTFAWAEDLLVSAAASLTNAFEEIKPAFEQQYPDTTLVFNFAASGPLLSQMQQGAPVDVFASADQVTMDKATALIEPSTRTNFAGNALVLIAPSTSSLEINNTQDLLNKEIQLIAVGNPESVPAGRYTQAALESLDLYQSLTPKLVLAESVRQALDYVARGEVQAGFVYATDATLKKDQVQIRTEITGHEPISYPIAMVKTSKNKELGQQFIDFILSDQGQTILKKYGFSPKTD